MKRVYFIKPIGMDGPIKIGCSVSPEGRRASLEAWCPFPLEVMAEIEGSYDLEQRFHARFLHLHERLEWFAAGEDLLAAIADIRGGRFDIDSLPRASGTIASLKSRAAPWEAIDYEYYDLFQHYRALPHAQGWWRYRTLNPSEFAKRSPAKKQEVLAGLRHFMVTYRPDQQVAA